MDVLPQTTSVYDHQYSIQEEFSRLLDDHDTEVVSEGNEFILKSLSNRTSDSLPPMTLSQYCLLQTIWALSSGHSELAETLANKTLVCYDLMSEEWLKNFQFDSSLIYNFVKSTSRLTEGNKDLQRIALSISQTYKVLIKAAERGDDSLIKWLLAAGLDLDPIGNEAVATAWTEGHIDTVSLLLELGALKNILTQDVAKTTNSRGETLLHFAASRGLRFLINRLIDAGAKVDKKDENYLTPLYHAVRANEDGVAQILLERGADRWTRSQSGNSLLHLAVIDNSTEAVYGLLQYGIPIETENGEELTPLFLAAQHGYHNLGNFLIERGANPNAITKSNNTLLHIAAKKGKLMTVKNLIRYGAFINKKNGEGVTPLYEAVSVGSSEVITFLLNQGAACKDSLVGESLLHIAARRGDNKVMNSLLNLCNPVDILNQKGITPLYSAASEGKLEAMELLLSRGADLYITLRNGQRLLHVAAVDGDVVAITSLLNAGIYVDVKDTDMLTSLCRAVQVDNTNSTTHLIEKGANTSFRTSDGDTLLHLAAASSSHKSIQLLVEHGLGIDEVNGQNETPLYVAAKNNKNKTANVLIALGANKYNITSKGGTLAHLAVAKNDLVALKTLFNIGVDFNVVDMNGHPPLYCAIREGKVKAANIMLESGVDLFFSDIHNDTLLHIAGREGKNTAIDFLIDRDVYIDSEGSNGYRPVDIALLNGHCSTAEHFIRKGANVRGRNRINQTVLHSAVIGDCKVFLKKIDKYIDNIDQKDVNMQTPLHLAAVLESTEIASTLLSLGADVNKLDKNNSTPLQYAVDNRNWDIVSLFLKKEVNLKWTDPDRRTLLHLATLDGKQEIIEFLTVRMRSDINQQDIDGRIPLHLAAEKGHSKIMSYMIDKGESKNVDYRDYRNRTPLHLAAIGGHQSATEFLLNSGADPQVTDSNRQTPLIYAAKHHHWYIVEQLLGETCITSYINNTDKDRRTVLHFAVLDEKGYFISRRRECWKEIINSKDSNEETPLDLAISKRQQYIVNYFFDNYKTYLRLNNCIALTLMKARLWDVVNRLSVTEVNSECEDEDKRTLLHLAALEGQETTVHSLLRNRDIDVDATDIDNRTPLHLAAIKNRYTIVKILLEYGAKKDIQDKDHKTPLILALSNKAWDSVQELLDNNIDVNWTDNSNRSLLHYAAISGQEKITKYLLKNRHININARDNNLDTPLHLLVLQNNLTSYVRKTMIDHLVQNGADWNAMNKQKQNILHLVVSSGDKEILNYILNRYRFDVNSRDINLQTPLHIAIINKHYNLVDTLLEYGADKNVLDINHVTPLVYAVNDSWDNVNLLDKSVEVNWTDSNNRSLLHLAAMHGCSKVLLKLLTLSIRKISIDALDINEQTPLHLAAQANNDRVVELLLGEGANASILDKEYHSPLDLAVIHNCWKAVYSFLIKDSYRECRYDENRTMLHLAILNGRRNVIDYLINNNLTYLGDTDNLRDTPLHIAASKNDSITVRKLLDNGAEKDALNGIGQRSLMVAMVSDSWSAVSTLLEGNCDVDGLDGNNRTLLHLAAMNGKEKIIDYVLKCRNVNINALDCKHETPLDLLLENNHWRIAYERSGINWRDGRGGTIFHRVLLESYYYPIVSGDFSYKLNNFGTIDAVDNEMRTLLHIASLNGNVSVLEDLILYGGSINAIDTHGQSPLHLAAMNGHVPIIRWVLESTRVTNYCESYYQLCLKRKDLTIRFNARDLLGRTPLQLSLDYGHHETAKLLKEYGATI